MSTLVLVFALARLGSKSEHANHDAVCALLPSRNYEGVRGWDQELDLDLDRECTSYCILNHVLEIFLTVSPLYGCQKLINSGLLTVSPLMRTQNVATN